MSFFNPFYNNRNLDNMIRSSKTVRFSRSDCFLLRIHVNWLVERCPQNRQLRVRRAPRPWDKALSPWEKAVLLLSAPSSLDETHCFVLLACRHPKLAGCELRFCSSNWLMIYFITLRNTGITNRTFFLSLIHYKDLLATTRIETKED